MKSTADLIQIAFIGGGLILDASKKSTSDIMQIVNSGKETTIIIKNANSKSTSDLLRIATLGKGRVLFDFTE